MFAHSGLQQKKHKTPKKQTKVPNVEPLNKKTNPFTSKRLASSGKIYSKEEFQFSLSFLKACAAPELTMDKEFSSGKLFKGVFAANVY